MMFSLRGSCFSLNLVPVILATIFERPGLTAGAVFAIPAGVEHRWGRRLGPSVAETRSSSSIRSCSRPGAPRPRALTPSRVGTSGDLPHPASGISPVGGRRGAREGPRACPMYPSDSATLTDPPRRRRRRRKEIFYRAALFANVLQFPTFGNRLAEAAVS